MAGYKDFFEKIAWILNVLREGCISELELSDLGLSCAAGYVAI